MRKLLRLRGNPNWRCSKNTQNHSHFVISMVQKRRLNCKEGRLSGDRSVGRSGHRITGPDEYEFALMHNDSETWSGTGQETRQPTHRWFYCQLQYTSEIASDQRINTTIGHIQELTQFRRSSPEGCACFRLSHCHFFGAFIHRAMSSTTSSCTCPALPYSAGMLFPAPAMKRWFSSGYNSKLTFLLPRNASFQRS